MKLLEKVAAAIADADPENDAGRTEVSYYLGMAKAAIDTVRQSGRCPFRDPKFTMDADAPCPICGGLGHPDSPSLCTDP